MERLSDQMKSISHQKRFTNTLCSLAERLSKPCPRCARILVSVLTTNCSNNYQLAKPLAKNGYDEYLIGVLNESVFERHLISESDNSVCMRSNLQWAITGRQLQIWHNSRCLSFPDLIFHQHKNPIWYETSTERNAKQI